jgi:HSP20 family protein
MPKRGNGAHVSERTSEERLPARTSERAWLPAFRMESPLRRLREEMDYLFDRFFGNAPATFEPWSGMGDRFWDMDVEETDNEIMVRSEAPGFEPKDFDIHVSGNTLTIRAEHKAETEKKGEGSQRWERRTSQFQRMIPLSTEVDPDKVDARYHNGILEVRLPRTEPRSRRRIEVKS